MAELRSATLVAVAPLTEDTSLYRFAFAEPLVFTAGQFINLVIPGPEHPVSRAYSIWSAPGDKAGVELCIKLLGAGVASDYLRARRPGDVLEFRGPYGNLLLPADTSPVVLVATGTGLAPFHSMLVHAAVHRDPRRFELYFGVRSQADLFAVDALELLRHAISLRTTICLSRPEPGWQGFSGRVTSAIGTPPENANILLCGNVEMVEEARRLLLTRGVDPGRVRYEKYG